MALNITTYDCVMEILEPMLGTVPKNRKVFTSFIQAKARERIAKDAAKGIPLANGEAATAAAVEERLAPEEETIQEIEDRGHTGFFEDDKGIFLYDYAIRGFLSESARTLKEWTPPRKGKGKAAESAEAEEGEEDEGEEGDDAKAKKPASSTLLQLQDKVKRYVFVCPRRIYLAAPGTKLEALERPLRALTAQGPRVTVVRSDLIPAGQLLKFQIKVLKVPKLNLPEALLRDVLEYAQLQGFGQWRSGGYGRASLVSLVKQ